MIRNVPRLDEWRLLPSRRARGSSRSIPSYSVDVSPAHSHSSGGSLVVLGTSDDIVSWLPVQIGKPKSLFAVLYRSGHQALQHHSNRPGLDLHMWEGVPKVHQGISRDPASCRRLIVVEIEFYLSCQVAEEGWTVVLAALITGEKGTHS